MDLLKFYFWLIVFCDKVGIVLTVELLRKIFNEFGN